VLTLFSIPKVFNGHIGIIQRNALTSWMRLGNGVQVILCGNDTGVAEAARDAGAEHVPDIQRTEYGTPIVSSAFSTVARMARNPLLCYVNTDIMFTDELICAAASVRKRKFLMVGRRHNVDITEPWDFSDPHWQEKLLMLTHDRGSLFNEFAVDYFLFPRESELIKLPPFAVGRPGWDNFVLFRCRQLRYPLIDATNVVTAVHQNHDYAHVPRATSYLWHGPEADANMKLLGGDESLVFGMMDATHKLTKFGLQKVSGPEYSLRRRSKYVILYPRRKFFVKAFITVKAVLRRVGFLSVSR
jgi:hypothetical protein